MPDHETETVQAAIVDTSIPPNELTSIHLDRRCISKLSEKCKQYQFEHQEKVIKADYQLEKLVNAMTEEFIENSQ